MTKGFIQLEGLATSYIVFIDSLRDERGFGAVMDVLGRKRYTDSKALAIAVPAVKGLKFALMFADGTPSREEMLEALRKLCPSVKMNGIEGVESVWGIPRQVCYVEDENECLLLSMLREFH